jgi:penicillin-binding protein 2
LDLLGSIQHSCNPYYYLLYKRIIYQDKSPNKFKDAALGLENWRNHVTSFGLGDRLGIDIPNEQRGNIPTGELYDKIYGKLHWRFETVYSLGIGQGEILVVPLQMANLASVIANRGYYYAPHLVRQTNLLSNTAEPAGMEKHETTVGAQHFGLIRDGMEQVVQNGTARRAKIDSIVVCGKTGTAENPHGEDHSVFIAFAPKDDPKIAISVVVENSGFGGTWAAPIASLMIEKYLTDSVSRPDAEARILEADFIHLKQDTL